MKPLLAKELENFLKRFNYFIDAEFRHIEIISPTTIALTLATQDEARAFDWVSITLQFDGVQDARLIENSKLNFIDMSDGISLIYEEKLFAFGIGKCNNLSSIKNSTCQIVSLNLKYKESNF
jgi:hypothetical protein